MTYGGEVMWMPKVMINNKRICIINLYSSGRGGGRRNIMAVCVIMEETYANGMGFSHFYMRLYEHCGRQEG
jgi:hypothetical protein